MNDLIRAEEFCRGHRLEVSYLHSLQEFGLIEVVRTKGQVFISSDELPRLEKIVMFQRELQINLEGVDVIMNLLERVAQMQDEATQLRNTLRRYEEPSDQSEVHPSGT